jgi:hypothetical protein
MMVRISREISLNDKAFHAMLAFRFSEELFKLLGRTVMREVIEQNMMPPFDCCATHDYCDANMVMLDALYTIDSCFEDIELSDLTPLFNGAWSIAKEQDFFVDYIRHDKDEDYLK